MINYKDDLLKKYSYDMGFGSYVMDLYIENGSVSGTNLQYKITRSSKNDCELLYDLVEESRYYYLNAPIFLKREIISKESIQEVIEKKAVFLAWDNDNPIGFINIEISDNYDIIQLISTGAASISPLGLYIKPEYRNKGIGKSLLNMVFEYCKGNGIKHIHVDYETANINANKFWPKYFDPKIISIRRTINKDIKI
jgi:GNAT superfamily N-acetyltransferase